MSLASPQKDSHERRAWRIMGIAIRLLTILSLREESYLQVYQHPNKQQYAFAEL